MPYPQKQAVVGKNGADQLNETSISRKMIRSTVAVIGGIMTFLIVDELIGLLTEDLVYSVIPGWHTTISPPHMTLTILTMGLLLAALVGVALYKLLCKAILTLWIRISKE